MEMPTKPKTRARAQTLFETAAGNGNLYTRNINATKQYTKCKTTLFTKQSSAAKLQHNKTKIKAKRNHLKLLVNLYFKFILCISYHLNKTIIKFNTNNNSQNCIINLPQKENPNYLQRISFSTVINFFNNFQFHYCRRKDLINYVQLTIRHFVGICLKRLIPLKRLPQIPEPSKITKPTNKYGHMQEKSRPNKGKFKAVYKAFLNWLEKSQKHTTKYFWQLQNVKEKDTFSDSEQQFLIITHNINNKGNNLFTQKLNNFVMETFYESCGQLKLQKGLPEMYKQKSTDLKNNIVEQLEKTSSQKITTKPNIFGLNLEYPSTKCRQLHVKQCKLQLVICNNDKGTFTIVPKVQTNKCSNIRNLKKIISKFQNKYGQLVDGCKHKHMKVSSFQNLKFTQREYNYNRKLFTNEIPETSKHVTEKYCQLSCYTIPYSCGEHNDLIYLIKWVCKSMQSKINKVVLTCGPGKSQQISAYLGENSRGTDTETQRLHTFSTNSSQICGQLNNYRNSFQPLTIIVSGNWQVFVSSKDSLQKYCRLKIFRFLIEINQISSPRARSFQQAVKEIKNNLTQLINYKTSKVLNNPPLRSYHLAHKIKQLRSESICNLQKVGTVSKTKYCFSPVDIISFNIIKQRTQKFSKTKLNFNEDAVLILQQKPGHFNQNDQTAKPKNLNSLLAELKNNETFSIISDKQSTFNQNQQRNFNQKLCIENNLQKQSSSLHFGNSEAEENVERKMKLAFKANNVRHFQLDDNNNCYQVKSKHQEFHKKCQHVLYTILCSCYCYFCYWHINGFPLVLLKIYKYLKDATVHVLTRRLKTTTAITTATKIATSIYNYSGNNETACDGKLKMRTKVSHDKGNQQNIFKRQQASITRTRTRTLTASICCGAYLSSCCSTTSLTASSSYCSRSQKNLILLKKLVKNQPQNQQQNSAYCRYQQHYRHSHHHHYHYKHNHQKYEQTQQQQQRHQLCNPNSTIHLQLPSLLVFSRTLIILILLSSLWHTSEGFHGSTVKLSTNTVKTKYGLVRGIVVRSSPSLVEAYLGIPYASPPVGSLRFMPPITPSSWKNVRNADRFSAVCPQNIPIPPNGPEALLEVPRARLAQLRRLLPLLSNQSEDCLYLNIYVPFENRRHRRFSANSGEHKDAPKLPTILFIHGESYEWNSGNPYDGSELAAHGNVIVVTINFRLGILGFLKTGGKESAQGNFGLMDLVAGLHWLKENLPAFGGDPQQITLLGHGTGAALANILVVSPVASDLIQHTVMVSGSALSPWAIQKNPLFVKRRVAEQTGCHGDMLYYDLAPCLRTKSVTDLLAVRIDHPRFLVGFAPFIDGTVISPNADSIGKLSLPMGSALVSTLGIEFANFPKRNLMFCLTSVESHLDLNAQDLEFGFNETRRDRILRTYVRNNFHYHLNEIFAVLKNEYTDWDQAIRSPLSSRDATLQFLSDGHTASALIKLGYMHSLRGGKGYFLHFKHRTVEEEYPQRTGSVRGEDVPFWLGLPISPLFPHNYTTQEKQISHLMLRYLANFAKTGNPNQSSLTVTQSSASSLMGTVALSLASSASATAHDLRGKIKRSSFNIVNATSLTSSGPNKSHHIIEDVETAAARQALNLAVLYNQRRTKRTYYKRHSRSNNDDHSGSASSEINYLINNNNDNSFSKLDSSVLPFWDAYDVVNQLYMELGNKAEIQSHYRGHKLSMWLNLIPQLHRHANMNDQSMRHHQFQDDLNNLNLYEGIVRAQIQTKPDDDEETLLLPRGRPTQPPTGQETNSTQRPQGGTTECGVEGAMFVAEMSTVLPPTENRSLVLDSREKEMATASTGIISNLEILRRLSGKQFPSYATALIATVAVGCFLFILNILIFAGIYHQREKRAKDAKTKEELQDNDASKNSSMLKLNALGSETDSYSGSGAGVSGKATVVFGEYNCYDEKSLQTKDEKLIVELPPKQIVDVNWASCSTSTLDLLKTKHHTPLDNSYTLGTIVPINTESQTEHLMEMVTYNPMPMATGLIIDPSFAATSSTGLLGKRGSIVGSSGQLNQYDFASVQSSDHMSFKDIENAVKVSATMNDDITQDDDIPEPPPPPRSFQNIQQQQGSASAAPATARGSGGGGGGILRQAGTTSATQTGAGKKRVHIKEISV